MAVTLNAAGTQASNGGATTLDYAGLTVAAGSNRALGYEVAWHVDPGAITVKNWDQAGTPQALEVLQAPIASANGQFVGIFGLVNPTTGNKALRLTWTNASEVAMNAVAFDGVDQTGGTTSFPNAATATGNTASATITITRPSNGAILAISACGTANGHSSVSATQLLLFSGAGAIDAGGSYSLASGTYTGTLTGTDQWVAAAVGVAAAVTVSTTIEWKAPAVQLTNHFVTSIVNMQAMSPMPVPYLTTTPTRVTNPLDWVTVTPDVIWTDG